MNFEKNKNKKNRPCAILPKPCGVIWQHDILIRIISQNCRGGS
jgi:hypothetical protein